MAKQALHETTFIMPNALAPAGSRLNFGGSYPAWGLADSSALKAARETGQKQLDIESDGVYCIYN